MTLTIEQQEILVNLDIEKNAEAQALKTSMANTLYEAFTEGGVEGASTDYWKANKYGEIAGKPPLNAGSPTLRTSNFYLFTGWFTQARFTMLGSDQIASALGHSFWQRLFSVGGFSYFIEIAFHLSVIFYSTFLKPVSATEEKLSFWERTALRFRNVLTKDDRLPRFVNCLIWAPLNLTAFILSGGMAILLNIAGFAVDIALTFGFAARNIYKHQNTLKALDNEIASIQAELLQLEKIQQYSETPVKEVTEKILHLQKEMNGLTQMRPALKKQIDHVTNDAIYGVTLTALILTSIALSFFPPTALIGAAIMAITLPIMVGTLIKSIGGKLSQWFSKPNETAQATAAESIDNTSDTPNRVMANAYADQTPIQERTEGINTSQIKGYLPEVKIDNQAGDLTSDIVIKNEAASPCNNKPLLSDRPFGSCGLLANNLLSTQSKATETNPSMKLAQN